MSVNVEKVTFKNEKEVKKWLRGVPVIKKELEMRMGFYNELAQDFSKNPWEKEKKYYQEKVIEIKRVADKYIEEYERLLSLLEEDERLIITTKYLKAIGWDYIEMYIYYSRRQAIRIRNRAVRKLIGQTVEVLKWKNNREE